jgi:hypothetical protein
MGTVGSVGADETTPAADLETIPGRLAAIAAELVDVTRALTVAVATRAAPDADLALDAAGVARALGVTLKQARNLIARRPFPVEHVGRYVRVRKGDLLAYRAAQREPARGLAPRLGAAYSSGHDEPRIAGAPAPPRPHAARPRRRRRRDPVDDRALGAGRPPDPAPRRHRLAVLRGAGDQQPLDVGDAAAYRPVGAAPHAEG